MGATGRSPGTCLLFFKPHSAVLALLYVYPEKQGAELGDSWNDLGDRQFCWSRLVAAEVGVRLVLARTLKEKLAGCPHGSEKVRVSI